MSLREDIKNVSTWKITTIILIVSLAGALLLQTLAFGVEAGNLKTQVAANADWIKASGQTLVKKDGAVSERLGRLEEGQTWIKDALKTL